MNINWTKAYFAEKGPEALNAGDKIILPSSALEDLLSAVHNNSENLPSPLTFELRHPHKRLIVYSGVKEFSSTSTDTMQLPSWMFESLQLDPNQRVVIKFCPLPKGTWAQLRPLSPDSTDISDYRAALESHLRAHYNTMAKGQVLTCRYGSQSYPFLITDLKPEHAVCITDTDLEVDLEPLLEAKTIENGNNDHHKRSVAMEEVVSGISIEKNQYRYWELKLDSAQQQQSVIIQLTVSSGDADLVVSSTDRRPTLENHAWASLTSETHRQLMLSPTSSTPLYIGIGGYSEDTTNVSWTTSILGVGQQEDTNMIEEEAEPQAHEPGYTQCQNCKAWIPERTKILHEGFCMRNNTICPHEGCGRVFKKGSQEFEHHWHCDQCNMVATNHDQPKHTAYFHSAKTCVCNGYTTDSYEDLAKHRRTTCPERLITCRYCHNLVPQGVLSPDSRDRLLNLHSHESYCGSRTITCQKCNRQIPIKDIQVHAKVHEVQKQNQRLPPLCSNQNCIRPRANNRLRLCQYCFGPFWVTTDDPKNVKLIQRVARKLHSQLTVGCGHAYCRNKYCATSTQKPQDATTAATTLLPMIQSLQHQMSLTNPNPELYLCVDESITRKRFLAEMLEEGTTKTYSIAWCAKALDSEDEDLERARSWLDKNAPKQNVTVNP
ncbi:ubiquitin fusion degradation protein UFD1-domain-containing protein [Phascolomyces articulosus]|uniref:Ubiquitin fusion degradation protein UFD1-domain-containing protein n=1 Tax=Phascolomyces articulosus TaxID=60185 RepID=A0AAD5JKM9_9FUNG|nr:ubiquitin fusion degradation protein UFD1-domain-containing protein [Phascolomyces articulosus]